MMDEVFALGTGKCENFRLGQGALVLEWDIDAVESA